MMLTHDCIMQIKGGNWVSAKELPNCTLQDDTINLHCCEILSETRLRTNNKIVFIQFPSSLLSCFLLCPDPIVETEDAMKHLFLWILLLTLTFQNIYLSSSHCANFTWTTTTCCVFLEHSTKKIQLFFAFILGLGLVVSSVLEWEFAWKRRRFDPNETRWKNKVKPLKRSSLFCLKLPWLYQYQTIINLIDINKDTPRARFKDSKEIYAFLQRFRSSLWSCVMPSGMC